MYGISYEARAQDPSLATARRDLVCVAARALDTSRMVRYDVATGYLNSTDLVRKEGKIVWERIKKEF